MKFKVKISALEHGRVVRFNHTFETPEFAEKELSFLNNPYTVSIFDQQNDWLDANYHLVVEICEQRYLYPIIGYTPIIAKQSVSKKSQVIDLFGEVSAGMSVEHKALVLGTLHDMWTTIKRFAPEKILEIVFESVNTTSKVSTAILKDVLKKLKCDEYKSLQY